MKLIVLDVLKPSDPSIVDLSKKLTEEKSVEAVDITITEIEQRVEKVRIMIEGDDVNFDRIKKVLEKFGVTIHRVNRVTRGSRVFGMSQKEQVVPVEKEE